MICKVIKLNELRQGVDSSPGCFLKNMYWSSACKTRSLKTIYFLFTFGLPVAAEVAASRNGFSQMYKPTGLHELNISDILNPPRH